MDENKSNSFPSDYAEALSLIYLDDNSLKDKSPKEAFYIYKAALDCILEEQRKTDKEQTID